VEQLVKFTQSLSRATDARQSMVVHLALSSAEIIAARVGATHRDTWLLRRYCVLRSARLAAVSVQPFGVVWRKTRRSFPPMSSARSSDTCWQRRWMPWTCVVCWLSSKASSFTDENKALRAAARNVALLFVCAPVRLSGWCKYYSKITVLLTLQPTERPCAQHSGPSWRNSSRSFFQLDNNKNGW